MGFDDKFIYNNCKQDSYIVINLISIQEKKLQYEERRSYSNIKEQIQFLKLLQGK